MTDSRKIPAALVEGAELPETTGNFDGHWYCEEDFGAVKLSIRVADKIHEEKSEYQKITVYDTPFFGRLLTLDDVVMLTERDEFVYHEMMIHVPLCSIPDPKSVLIIGGGDCGALREVLRHPGVERVVQCDIDERVTRVCETHFPWVQAAAADPRAEILFADGIRYIEEHQSSFDLIVIDSTDPKGPAVGLFLRDFYQSVARALRPGGVMTAQTESPHWEAAMVGAIYAEQRAAFKQTTAYVCSIPTYPSGCWTLAYASNDRRHDDYFDAGRAAALESDCLYYNAGIHSAAFALPNFAARAVHTDENVFSRFDQEHRLFLDEVED